METIATTSTMDSAQNQFAKRVFLIDDDKIHNFILSKVIEKQQAPVEYQQFTSAEKALEALDGIASGESSTAFPHIIIIDLDMPVMDGLSFMEKYQESHWDNYPETRLIMLTSSISDVDERKAMRYPSLEAYYRKPISFEDFERLITD